MMFKIADLLLDREILLKQVKKWKWMFFLSLLILLLSLGGKKDFASKGYKESKDIIAQVDIVGVIDRNNDLIDELKSLEEDKHVKALLLFIDSPGGTTYASEELYETIKKIKKTKPVVAVLGTVAASGGYLVALAADYIVARSMTITGSIGVISENIEVTELAQKLGIKLENYKSSPLKASPNFFEKTGEEVKQAEMEVINDSYDIFLKYFMESRKLKREQALELANGRIYIGKRAKDLNLIDSIGGSDEALKWLEKEKKIDKKIPLTIINWVKPKNFLEEMISHLNNSKMFNRSFSVKALAS